MIESFFRTMPKRKDMEDVDLEEIKVKISTSVSRSLLDAVHVLNGVIVCVCAPSCKDILISKLAKMNLPSSIIYSHNLFIEERYKGD